MTLALPWDESACSVDPSLIRSLSPFLRRVSTAKMTTNLANTPSTEQNGRHASVAWKMASDTCVSTNQSPREATLPRRVSACSPNQSPRTRIRSPNDLDHFLQHRHDFHGPKPIQFLITSLTCPCRVQNNHPIGTSNRKPSYVTRDEHFCHLPRAQGPHQSCWLLTILLATTI